MDTSITFENIALSVFSGLVQKSHAYGSDDADRKKLANIACQYADAFLAVLQARSASPVATLAR